MTNGNYSKQIQNGYNGSSPLPPSKFLPPTSDLENVHRASPPVSSVNIKTNASSRWIAPQFLHDIVDRNELIFRRVRGILNKLTPEKFDKLSRNLLNIGIDCKTILKGIIILIFEKAIDEPKYCGIYAQLCQKLSHEAPNFDDPSTKSNTFLRLLLSKCQEEFETRSKASSVFDRKDEPLSQAEQFAKEVAKRKMLGNLKFIGELGKFELLQEAILHKCIQQMLAKKKRTSLADMAEDIECLCQIVSTVGKRLDTLKAKNIMDQYFDRMETLSKSHELPSRIRFMLQDVIELRYQNWQPRRMLVENGPRSVSQMRWEMMGPMVPPYPYFSPDGMQPPHGMSSMMPPWYNESMYPGGMPPPGGNIPTPADDHTDIFGKKINKVPAPAKATPIARAPQAKPDLFEPHYLKSKNTSNPSASKPVAPSTNGFPNRNRFGASEEEKEAPKPKPPINKNNPWNMDPFVPHYNKPAVSMLSISNEQAAKNEKSNSSSTMKTSPQTMRSYNLPTSNSSSSNKQPPPKKNGEISLRPTSFLNKKEEKTKTIFTKTEEIPAKMQHFTNLTINDKTTKSNKKTALTKNDIDIKISEVVKQCKVENDVDAVCVALQSLCTNIKYSKMVAKQLIYFGANSPEEDWNFIGTIFIECISRSVLSVETTVNAFTILYDDAKVMETDSGKEFVAKFSAMFVVHDMLTFGKVIDHFQDGHQYPTALIFLERLYEEKGEEWLKELLNTAKHDLIVIFPKDSRSDGQLMSVAQEKNLTFIFPHLCLKEDLLALMRQGETEENLLQWLKDNVVDKVAAKLLTHMIVSSIVSMATQETLMKTDPAQKPEKEIQEFEKELIGKYKNLLKEFIGSATQSQLEAIYALQIYCHEKAFPKEMLLRLFIIFYNTELVDEDVFLQWKEDINETYPGKGKSLFQVNNWLQWLETADEEDEEEEEEEEA